MPMMTLGVIRDSIRTVAVFAAAAVIVAACGGAPDQDPATATSSSVQPAPLAPGSDISDEGSLATPVSPVSPSTLAATECAEAAMAGDEESIGTFDRAESTDWLPIAAMLEIEANQSRLAKGIDSAGEPDDYADGEIGASYLHATGRLPDDSVTVCVFQDGLYAPPGDGPAGPRPHTVRMVIDEGGLSVLSMPYRPAEEAMLPSEYDEFMDDELLTGLRREFDRPEVEAPAEFVEESGISSTN